MHPKSLKGNYEHHLTAFDRAMEAGIDDVGADVLFELKEIKKQNMEYTVLKKYKYEN